MAVKRLDYKQMTTAYVGASVISVTAGAVSGGLWDRLGGNTDYALWIGGSWLLVVGVPSMVVASDTLLKILGKKSPLQIYSNGGTQQGRAVPVNRSNGRKSTVFLSALTLPKLISGKQPEPTEQPQETNVTPQIFTVRNDGKVYQIPAESLRDFLYKAWARQRSGKAGFSRTYWMNGHRPRMNRVEYDAYMSLVTSINGLVINRVGKQSGQLALPPESAIKMIQGQY